MPPTFALNSCPLLRPLGPSATNSVGHLDIVFAHPLTSTPLRVLVELDPRSMTAWMLPEVGAQLEFRLGAPIGSRQAGLEPIGGTSVHWAMQRPPQAAVYFSSSFLVR